MASYLARTARAAATHSAVRTLAPATTTAAATAANATAAKSANATIPAISSVVGRALSMRADLGSASSYDPKPFPSLTVSGAAPLEANGVFAESQVAYLDPHQDDLDELKVALEAANLGVVAHFYMDPELQGLLAGVDWDHIVVADSLVMGDAAVRQAEAGVSAIAVLGVDFMTESVRAIMDARGFEHIPVYRVAPQEIGCSLASSAEALAYQAWLQTAAKKDNSLHVVYINTSLLTKAQAQATVPTITCTSGNVVQTILQAFSQIPDLTVFYGPDTYMGENLRVLFKTVSEMPNEQIKALHPAHDQASVRSLLDRLEVFQQGMCVVHHMFGDSVVDDLQTHYPDALLTAHLEVPGGMFELANEAAVQGRGVVGSTANILNFIITRTKEAVAAGNEDKLQFVLGTEAGMVTPIVKSVQKELMGQDAVKVEIIFPVASEAVHVTGESVEEGLSIVPGVSGGEGCSAAGGCATCPFMKMNTLDGLIDVANAVSEPGEMDNSKLLESLLPQRRGMKVNGVLASTLGSQPILHMRHLMTTGKISDELINDVYSR